MVSLRSVVATNPFSDWNVSPLPSHTKTSVHIEIEKVGPDVHIHYSYPAENGESERFLLREKKGFAIPLEQGKVEEWWIGAMVCGPLSGGTKGSVDDWKFELLDAIRSQEH